MRYILPMRILATRTLRDFYRQTDHQAAEQVVEAWIEMAKAAAWATPIDVKAAAGQTDILPDGRAIFDLGGNKYRLVVWINYRKRMILIKFIGTHKEYDKIDPSTVG